MIATRPHSRTLLAAFAVLAIMVSGAAIAWACTPGGDINARGPTGSNFGPQGSEMRVDATGFGPDAPVEVRWTNREGQTLRPLTTGRGPDFTVRSTVPSLADGVYYVVATGPYVDAETNEQMTREVVREFVIGEPAASPSPPADPDPSPAPGAGSPPTPAPGAAPAPGGAPTNRNPRSGSPGSPPPRSNPGGTTLGLPFSTGNDNGTPGERTRSGGGGGATSERDTVTTLPSGQAVFSDSLPDTGPNGTGSSDGAAGPATASNSAPSERSAGGDLRSGLSADAGSGRPALGGGTAESTRSPLVLGMALLGFGLVALVGSAGVAEARRRRRALARARR